MKNRTTSPCAAAMGGLSVFTASAATPKPSPAPVKPPPSGAPKLDLSDYKPPSSNGLQNDCKNCGPMESPAQELTDREALCLLFCCCNANPSKQILAEISGIGDFVVPPAATGLINPKKTIDFRQQCVSDALREANRLAAYQSRFKPEISYNMSTNPPSPFMHRDGGLDTTEPSRNWITRARTEIPNYQAGAGLVRRPDVVVVSNPAEPPIQSNIDHVYEMKFPGDRYDQDQMEDYSQIAGGEEKTSLLNAKNCGCGGEKMKQKVRALLPKPIWRAVEKSILQALQHPVPPPILDPEPIPEPIPLPIP